jgi:hypothetical protein
MVDANSADVSKWISSISGGEDRMVEMKEQNKTRQIRGTLVCFIVLLLSACATSPDASIQTLSPSSSNQGEMFITPEQAVETLVDATRGNDSAALIKILGIDAASLISSGDPVADKKSRDRFVMAYDSKHRLESEDDGKATLIVGEEEWPLPIPLVRDVNNNWQFDVGFGEQEILNRRIGRNEINVIGICRAYVDAQREFAAQHRITNGLSEYAQHIISTAGKHDGLYWPAKVGEKESPLGPLIANARAEGYVDGEIYNKRQPYHGYYYKILRQQGPSAAEGAKNYIFHGHMTKGFALLAFPAKYGDSGIMTFIVNQNGIVFEKNIGPETPKIVARTVQYNPDESWKVVGAD